MIQNPCRRPLFLAAQFLVLATSARAAESTPDTFGFVLEIKGQWLAEAQPAAALKLGQSVLAGTTVKARDPMGGAAFIVIAPLDGSAPIRRDCDSGPACELKLSASGQSEPGLAGRLSDAVLALFRTEPKRYVPTMSRGGSPECDAAAALKDGIASLASSKIDLSALFEEVAPGRYAISFRALATANPPAQTATVEKTTARTSVDGAEIVPGLYEITVLQPTTHEACGLGAWVAVCAGASCARVDAAYRQVVAATESWRDTASPRAVLAFRRAGLERAWKDAQP